MLALIAALSSLLVCRFRSRAALELELVALRHQLAVLRRQPPRRPKLTSMDRLLWIWLYRGWPRCLKVMVLVKSATVVGFSEGAPPSTGQSNPDTHAVVSLLAFRAANSLLGSERVS